MGSRGSKAAETPQAPRNLPAKINPAETIAAVQESLEGREATLAAYLSQQNVSPERFVRTVLQAIGQNRKLGLSTKNSLVFAVLEAAQMGLEPTGILGGAYLVPYWSSKLGAYEAKLIVGYRGYIDLLIRSGHLDSIEARVVYDGDEFDVSYGTEQRIRHVPYYLRDKASGDRVAVYWIARMRGGAIVFDVLPISEIEAARRSSRAADGGPWTEWFDEMAKKTAIRRAVKTLPISVFEARRAVQLEDEAEGGADVEPMARGAGKPTARDRAVALLAAGDDEAAAEEAPESTTPEETAEQGEADSGAPTSSEHPGEPEILDPDDEDDLPDVPAGKKDDGAEDLGL